MAVPHKVKRMKQRGVIHKHVKRKNALGKKKASGNTGELCRERSNLGDAPKVATAHPRSGPGCLVGILEHD